jgi:hypothetical protein
VAKVTASAAASAAAVVVAVDVRDKDDIIVPNLFFNVQESGERTIGCLDFLQLISVEAIVLPNIQE